MDRESSWLVPISGAFFGLALGIAAVLAGPGCQTRCGNNFDCGTGYCSPLGRCETECFTNEDCLHPPECQDNPTACRPRGLLCNAIGRCQGVVSILNNGSSTNIDIDRIPDELEGWDDPPGTGAAFIVNQIAIAERNRGFDIDGQCGPTGCIDNFLAPLGELGNDQIRQGLLGGESLLLLELAGLDDPYRGDDESMTVKVYSARDADDPFFPANNFKVPPGRNTCCEFKINPASLANTPRQARARAPARIERARLRSLAPVPIQFTLTVGLPPHPEIKISQVLLSGRIPASLERFDDGLLGGAVPINTLANTENPYCKTVSPRCPVQFADSTLIDLVSNLLGSRPDIDLDGDGLECVKDQDGDGAIDLCCDQDVDTCAVSNECAVPVDALDPTKPWTCARNPQIGDGYSIAIDFTAVRSTIVGVGQ